MSFSITGPRTAQERADACANELWDAMADNDMALVTQALGRYVWEQKITPDVMDTAVELNNQDALDLTILEALIRSNKFDVTAEQFQLAKKPAAQKAFQTYMAS